MAGTADRRRADAHGRGVLARPPGRGRQDLRAAAAAGTGPRRLRLARRRRPCISVRRRHPPGSRRAPGAGRRDRLARPPGLGSGTRLPTPPAARQPLPARRLLTCPRIDLHTNRPAHEPNLMQSTDNDLSQPPPKLSADEQLKAASDQLRGTILRSLADPLTGAASAGDAKLLKFHGIYQQDDREERDERRRQKLEPAYQFMIRVRLPGGVCSAAQWLKLDELARAYGGDSLRLTTRQTFQFHWVLKHNLQATLQGLHEVLLDTIAACGDDARGVMCTADPRLSALHAAGYDIARQASDHAIPRMRAYHEIWWGEQRVASSDAGSEEPFYGQTYLPRKFKIGFVIPPVNDIDVYAQDL